MRRWRSDSKNITSSIARRRATYDHNKQGETEKRNDTTAATRSTSSPRTIVCLTACWVVCLCSQLPNKKTGADTKMRFDANVIPRGSLREVQSRQGEREPPVHAEVASVVLIHRRLTVCLCVLQGFVPGLGEVSVSSLIAAGITRFEQLWALWFLNGRNASVLTDTLKAKGVTHTYKEIAEEVHLKLSKQGW